MSSTRPHLHGWYSPALPGHPAWNILRPILNASNCRDEGRHFFTTTGLQSSPSVAFDFKFTDIDMSICQPIVLDVLLLSPACLKSTREATISRVEKFLHFSHSRPFRTAIVLILEDDSSLRQSDGTWWLSELMELEVIMMKYAPKACPILPISDTSKFLDVIRIYMGHKITGFRNLPPLCADKPLAIFTRMTNYGSQADDAHLDDILACIYSSLRDVSQARNSDQITSLLQTYLGVKYDGQKIADFLREDSKVD